MSHAPPSLLVHSWLDFVLSWQRLGQRFTLKSLGAVALVSVDIAVVLTALLVVPPQRVLRSVVGAVAIGVILTLNHRPGRYLGV